MKTESSHNNLTREFQVNGVLRLPNSIDIPSVRDIKAKLYCEVEAKFGIRINEPETWHINANNPVGDHRASRLNGMKSIMESIKASGRLDRIEGQITDTINRIFGVNHWAPIESWYSLLSFPGVEKTWNVPHQSWHNDEPIVVGDPLPWSIFVFVFLDKVTTENGPTVVIQGSHRLGESIAKKYGVYDSNSIKAFEHVNKELGLDAEETKLLPVGQLLPRLARKDPWFKELVNEHSTEDRTRYFRDEKREYQLVEITGDIGDIILLDPRCLHTFSAKISRFPRQVLRIDFRRNAE